MVDLFCHSIRVSPFTDAKMLRQKLVSYFGDLDYEESVLEFMIILIHIDLEHGNSLRYNGPAGLLDLYIAAGGSKSVDTMQAELFKIQHSLSRTDPLIKDLRKKFDRCKLIGVGNEMTALKQLSKQRSVRLNSMINLDDEEEKKDEDNSRRKSDFVSEEGMGLATLKAASKFKRISAVARVNDTLSYDEFYNGKCALN